MMTDRQLLQNSGLGNYLEPEEIQMMLAFGKLTEYSDGEVIMQQGKMSNGIYVVVEGAVEKTARMLGEMTTIIDVFSQGEFFGEISFTENVPSAASVIAKGKVKCLFLTRIYLESISENYRETKYKLFNEISQQVCTRLKKMHDKVVTVISSAEMITQSMFTEMMHSLTKPSQYTLEEGGITYEYLRNMTVFSRFTDDELQELFTHLAIITAPKRCTIIHEGGADSSCYIVIQGAVQSSIHHEMKYAKLSVIGPSTLFSGTSCIGHHIPFTANFMTCEHAILLRLSEEDVEYFKKNHPVLWYKLFDLIFKSLVALEKSVNKLDIRLNIEIYNR